MSRYGWRPYVPVARRRARAHKEMAKLSKKGLEVQPVEIEGRKIARTFWGEAWCDHLESFSDYENRLPRGRTYVRNGSVCHLNVAKGEVRALVSGSELYNVTIAIKTLGKKKWAGVRERCAGQIGSLLELLQGKLSKSVMEVVTDRAQGLFPLPGEIDLKCSCPDWAVMCKHVAAVLYGVGARLDHQPELLFLLRGVDHDELIRAEVGVATAAAPADGDRKRIADDELTDIFGIEMSEEDSPSEAEPPRDAAEIAAEPAKAPKDRPARSRKRGTGQKSKAAKRGGPRRTSAADAGTTSRGSASSRPVTGKAVARLRAKFGMSKAEFARLLGVSAPSIGNWEKKPGDLNLQARTLESWSSVERLTKRQAQRKLSDTTAQPVRYRRRR